MGAIQSKRKILSNATSEPLSAARRKKLHQKATKNTSQYVLSADGYIKQVGVNPPSAPPSISGFHVSAEDEDEVDEIVVEELTEQIDPFVLKAPKVEGDDEMKDFSVITLEEALTKQDAMISHVADILGVTLDKAASFLIHYRWNSTKLIEEYRENPERVCTEAGVLVADCASIRDPRDKDIPQRRPRARLQPPGSEISLAVNSNTDTATTAIGSAEASRVEVLSASAQITQDLQELNTLLEELSPQTPRRTRFVTPRSPSPTASTSNVPDGVATQLGITAEELESRLKLLGELTGLTDRRRLQSLLLGAGGDLNTAANHFLMSPEPPSPVPSSPPAPVVLAPAAPSTPSQRLSVSYATVEPIDRHPSYSRIVRPPSVGLRTSAPPVHAQPAANVPARPIEPIAAPAPIALTPRIRRAVMNVISTFDGDSDGPDTAPALHAPVPAAAATTFAVEAIRTNISESGSSSSQQKQKEQVTTSSAAESDASADLFTPSEPPLPSATWSPPKATLSADERMCSVCMCPTPASQFARLECGHEFCTDCWAGHLSAKLSEGPACVFATCMAPKCDLHIGPAQWKKLAAPALYQRYLTHLHRSFVNNVNVLWCLNPISCDYIIAYSGEDRPRCAVRCRCGFSFCWSCRFAKHEPISCEQLREWNEKCEKEKTESAGEWIVVSAKPCPSCKVPIEKNDGCMHMTCTQCKHEFCWLCRQPYSTHGEQTGGFFACNRYATSTAKSLDDRNEAMKEEFRRFLHFYERYAQHSRSKQIASKLIADAPEKLRALERQQTERRKKEEEEQRRLRLQQVTGSKLLLKKKERKSAKGKAASGSSVIESPSASKAAPGTAVASPRGKIPLSAASMPNFFLEAAHLVYDCRSVLEHSYAFAFYLPANKTSLDQQLFEYLQANLEAATERLTELIETPLEQIDPDALVSYTKATKKFLDNFLLGMRTGLVDSVYNSSLVRLIEKLKNGALQLPVVKKK